MDIGWHGKKEFTEKTMIDLEVTLVQDHLEKSRERRGHAAPGGWQNRPPPAASSADVWQRESPRAATPTW
jgi:hypothetical protein